MSFLKDFGGAGGLAGGVGHLFGTDGAHVSSLADRIGKGANMIASGGGATAGYDGSAAAPQIDNHLQMLDPNILQSIIARFRPTPQGYAR